MFFANASRSHQSTRLILSHVVSYCLMLSHVVSCRLMPSHNGKTWKISVVYNNLCRLVLYIIIYKYVLSVLILSVVLFSWYYNIVSQLDQDN